MAAEAPITAKKGEYSGLSSEDILALLSLGAITTLRGRLSSLCEGESPVPPSALGRFKKKDCEDGKNDSASGNTGVEEENGETGKVT